MWMMLQEDTPDDYVVATGETHSVREFAEIAFAHVGLDYREHVVVNREFFRPAEVHVLLGDPAKARKRLHWTPSCGFRELVEEMVETDLERLDGMAGVATERGAMPSAKG
jgi:GDPmannose 4,6-dehydratase